MNSEDKCPEDNKMTKKHGGARGAALADLDLLVLTVDLPRHGLRAGDVGTVVHVYRDGQAYEAEFTALDGTTVAVTTVEAAQVRAVVADEIAQARPLVAA